MPQNMMLSVFPNRAEITKQSSKIDTNTNYNCNDRETAKKLKKATAVMMFGGNVLIINPLTETEVGVHERSL